MTRQHWGLAATLLAVAIIAVVVLPPRPIPDQYSFAASMLGISYTRWFDGGEGFTQTARRVRDRQAERIAAQPHGAADVRAARGPLALRSTRERVTVVRDPDVPSDVAREWLRDAETELSFYPRAASAGVPVIVGLHTSNIFSGSGWQHPTFEAARFLHVEGRDTVCIADVRLPGRDTTRMSGRFSHLQSGGWWDDRRMGRCALYARYGVPGAFVQAWFGVGPQWRWTDDGTLRAYLARRSGPRRPIERAQRWGPFDWPTDLACLSSGVGCDDVFRVRRPREGTQSYYRGEISMLIADLLKSHEPDRFVRFWRSSLPVDSALLDAYGVPGGSLGREAWLRRVTPPPPAGAHRGAAATSVAWLAGLLGLAMVLSRRQTMGL